MQLKVLHRPDAIARRVHAVGRQISKDYAGKTVDVVGVLNNGHIFMADLVRSISVPVRVHFIRAEMIDTTDPQTGKERQEIFYSPEIDAAGRNIVVVRGVLQSGVTTDFLLRRIGLHNPRTMKLAACVDKPDQRKVLLEADYYAFRAASNNIVVGYGLAWDGMHGNLPYLGTWSSTNRGARRGRRGAVKTAKTRRKKVRRKARARRK